MKKYTCYDLGIAFFFILPFVISFPNPHRYKDLTGRILPISRIRRNVIEDAITEDEAIPLVFDEAGTPVESGTTNDIIPISKPDVGANNILPGSQPDVGTSDILPGSQPDVGTSDILPGSQFDVGTSDILPGSQPDVGASDILPGSHPDVGTSDVLPGSQPDVGTSDIIPGSQPDVGTSDILPGSQPDVGTSDILPGSQSDVETSDILPGSQPDVGTSDILPGSQPAVGTSDIFPGSQPDVGTSDIFPESRPDVGTSDNFQGSQPDVGTSDIFPGSQPDVGTGDILPGSQPDLGTRDISPGTQPDVGTSDILPGSQPDVGTSDILQGSQPDVGTSDILQGSQSDVGTSDILPGLHSDVGTSAIIPGSQSDVGTSDILPRSQIDVGTNDILPESQTDVGTNDILPGSQPDVGANDILPESQPDVGTNDILPRSRPEVGTSDILPRSENDLGTNDILAGSQTDVGTTDIQTGSQTDVGTTDIQTGSQTDVGTTDIQTGSQTDVGTTDIQTGSQTDVGTTDIQTGSQPDVGINEMIPGSQTDVGTTDIQTGSQPDVGINEMIPGSQTDVGTTDIQTGSQPDVGINEMIPESQTELGAGDFLSGTQTDVETSNIKSGSNPDVRNSDILPESQIRVETSDILPGSQAQIGSSSDILMESETNVGTNDIFSGTQTDAGTTRVLTAASTDDGNSDTLSGTKTNVGSSDIWPGSETDSGTANIPSTGNRDILPLTQTDDGTNGILQGSQTDEGTNDIVSGSQTDVATSVPFPRLHSDVGNRDNFVGSTTGEETSYVVQGSQNNVGSSKMIPTNERTKTSLGEGLIEKGLSPVSTDDSVGPSFNDEIDPLRLNTKSTISDDPLPTNESILPVSTRNDINLVSTDAGVYPASDDKNRVVPVSSDRNIANFSTDDSTAQLPSFNNAPMSTDDGSVLIASNNIEPVSTDDGILQTQTNDGIVPVSTDDGSLRTSTIDKNIVPVSTDDGILRTPTIDKNIVPVSTDDGILRTPTIDTNIVPVSTDDGISRTPTIDNKTVQVSTDDGISLTPTIDKQTVPVSTDDDNLRTPTIDKNIVPVSTDDGILRTPTIDKNIVPVSTDDGILRTPTIDKDIVPVSTDDGILRTPTIDKNIVPVSTDDGILRTPTIDQDIVPVSTDDGILRTPTIDKDIVPVSTDDGILQTQTNDKNVIQVSTDDDILGIRRNESIVPVSTDDTNLRTQTNEKNIVSVSTDDGILQISSNDSIATDDGFLRIGTNDSIAQVSLGDDTAIEVDNKNSVPRLNDNKDTKTLPMDDGKIDDLKIQTSTKLLESAMPAEIDRGLMQIDRTDDKSGIPRVQDSKSLSGAPILNDDLGRSGEDKTDDKKSTDIGRKTESGINSKHVDRTNLISRFSDDGIVDDVKGRFNEVNMGTDMMPGLKDIRDRNFLPGMKDSSFTSIIQELADSASAVEKIQRSRTVDNIEDTIKIPRDIEPLNITKDFGDDSNIRDNMSTITNIAFIDKVKPSDVSPTAADDGLFDDLNDDRNLITIIPNTNNIENSTDSNITDNTFKESTPEVATSLQENITDDIYEIPKNNSESSHTYNGSIYVQIPRSKAMYSVEETIANGFDNQDDKSNTTLEQGYQSQNENSVTDDNLTDDSSPNGTIFTADKIDDASETAGFRNTIDILDDMNSGISAKNSTSNNYTNSSFIEPKLSTEFIDNNTPSTVHPYDDFNDKTGPLSTASIVTTTLSPTTVKESFSNPSSDDSLSESIRIDNKENNEDRFFSHYSNTGRAVRKIRQTSDILPDPVSDSPDVNAAAGPTNEGGGNVDDKSRTAGTEAIPTEPPVNASPPDGTSGTSGMGDGTSNAAGTETAPSQPQANASPAEGPSGLSGNMDDTSNANAAGTETAPSQPQANASPAEGSSGVSGNVDDTSNANAAGTGTAPTQPPLNASPADGSSGLSGNVDDTSNANAAGTGTAPTQPPLNASPADGSSGVSGKVDDTSNAVGTETAPPISPVNASPGDDTSGTSGNVDDKSSASGTETGPSQPSINASPADDTSMTSGNADDKSIASGTETSPIQPPANVSPSDDQTGSSGSVPDSSLKPASTQDQAIPNPTGNAGAPIEADHIDDKSGTSNIDNTVPLDTSGTQSGTDKIDDTKVPSNSNITPIGTGTGEKGGNADDTSTLSKPADTGSALPTVDEKPTDTNAALPKPVSDDTSLGNKANSPQGIVDDTAKDDTSAQPVNSNAVPGTDNVDDGINKKTDPSSGSLPTNIAVNDTLGTVEPITGDDQGMNNNPADDNSTVGTGDDANRNPSNTDDNKALINTNSTDDTGQPTIGSVDDKTDDSNSTQMIDAPSDDNNTLGTDDTGIDDKLANETTSARDAKININPPISNDNDTDASAFTVRQPTVLKSTDVQDDKERLDNETLSNDINFKSNSGISGQDGANGSVDARPLLNVNTKNGDDSGNDTNVGIFPENTGQDSNNGTQQHGGNNTTGSTDDKLATSSKVNNNLKDDSGSVGTDDGFSSNNVLAEKPKEDLQKDKKTQETSPSNDQKDSKRMGDPTRQTDDRGYKPMEALQYSSPVISGVEPPKKKTSLSKQVEKRLQGFRREVAQGVSRDNYPDNIDECITNIVSLLVSMEVEESEQTKPKAEKDAIPLTCTFENGSQPCFLESAKHSELQWESVRTSSSISLTTLPVREGAEGSHNFLFVDNKQKHFGFATLETSFGPLFPKKLRCFSFYYLMSGDDIGSLSVIAVDNFKNEYLLFEEKGDKGASWQYTKIDVPALDGLKLVIEAETGSGQMSNIAIDDLTLSSGTCDNVTQPYEITTTFCDSVPCQNGATCLDNEDTFKCICTEGWAGDTCDTRLFVRRCSFESSDEDACFFKNVDKGDKFDWERHRGKTESKLTGPNKAYRGNYYLYAEGSKPQRRGYIARLETEKIEPEADRCISFWYSMRGKGMGTMRLMAKGKDDKSAVVLWEKSGNQGVKWQKTNPIDVPEMEDLVLTIEMIRGWNWTSDAAIDDIVLSPGRCYDIQNPVPTSCDDGNPCNNGGTCQDTFKCTCSTDWTGKTCSKKVLPCDLMPCKHGGSCYNFGNTYQCACRPGFGGIDCEVVEPGNRCVSVCSGLYNGNYQSCRGCSGYVACSNQSPIQMNCPDYLVWDDDAKTCERTSSTCV